MLVYKLREKIGLDNSSAFTIVAIYQQGYVLQVNGTY